MLLGFFMISFVVAVAFGSFFVYQQAREAAWAMPADVGVTTVVDLPAVILPSVAPEGAPQKPVAALPGAVVPRIDGEFNPVPAPVVEPAADKRITVLLLGVDQRPDDPNPPRTDNMIVLTLNLSSGQAGMISLPRDLFVPIPGFDQSGKINTAYVVGESNDYPGGGGALAKKTVSDFLGYPIDYYAKVNFDGFVRAIDLIGGVDVDVAATIHDEQYPTIDYGVTTFHIDAGRQHLDGDTALKYVRTRHADSDFERARRQQQVLLAAKDKVMKNKLATTFQLLDFIDVLSSSIEHDVPTADLLDLAGLALKVQVDDIDQLVLDSQYGQVDADSAYGWILLPDRNKIRPAVDQIFISAEQPQQVNLEALARQRAQQQAELAQQQAELARQQVRNNYQAPGRDLAPATRRRGGPHRRL